MRILAVSPYPPWPLHGGTPVRVYHLLRGLAARGHQVTLLTGSERDEPDLGPLAEICEQVVCYRTRGASSAATALSSLATGRPYPATRYANREYAGAVKRVLRAGDHDLVWANFLFMLDPRLRGNGSGLPVVLEQHEVEEAVWGDYLRSGRLHERAFSAGNLALLRVRRRQARPLVDAVVSVSSEEAMATRRLWPAGPPVWTVPNGVDTQGIRPIPLERAEPGAILLCASMNVRRNADAADWFARRVFRLVRRRVPNAFFCVVGADPTPGVRRLAQLEGVEVTGRVEDVRPFYERASVVVAPYRYGAGTKIKTLEALAMGRPVVATPNGCQGIAVEDGRDLIVASEPERMAAAVSRLLAAPDEAARLAAAGRRLVESRYDWDALAGMLADRFRSVVGERTEIAA